MLGSFKTINSPRKMPKNKCNARRIIRARQKASIVEHMVFTK